MSRKEKEIIWHKKKSTFLPVSVEKTRKVPSGEAPAPNVLSDRERFANDMLEKIRLAVKKSSGNKSVP